MWLREDPYPQGVCAATSPVLTVSGTLPPPAPKQSSLYNSTNLKIMMAGDTEIQRDIFALYSWEINFSSEIILIKFHNKSNMYYLIQRLERSNLFPEANNRNIWGVHLTHRLSVCLFFFFKRNVFRQRNGLYVLRAAFSQKSSCTCNYILATARFSVIQF